MALGGVPNCPKCDQETLTYDIETNTYNCSPNITKSKTMYCSKTFNYEDINRTSWISC